MVVAEWRAWWWGSECLATYWQCSWGSWWQQWAPIWKMAKSCAAYSLELLQPCVSALLLVVSFPMTFSFFSCLLEFEFVLCFRTIDNCIFTFKESLDIPRPRAEKPQQDSRHRSRGCAGLEQL